MNKVAIVTLNGNFNFGNRLQNFALQRSIEGLGYEVDTLLFSGNLNYEAKKKSKLEKLMDWNTIKDIPNKLINYNERKLMKELHNKRVEEFKGFTKQYISELDIPLNNAEKFIEEKYSCVVVGSDQVWNPSYTNASDKYFLNFVSESKRVAYAPSFGVSMLPKSFESKYKKNLNQFSHLSVREEKGAEIINKLLGVEVPVLVDPTMLLSRDEWVSIETKVEGIEEKKYLLTYYLGEIPHERMVWLSKIASQKSLEIINLGDKKNRELYISEPGEFISYLRNCSLFCTDSFHGCVFAILFSKPFVAFNRMDRDPIMNSRIETLLGKFDLKPRYFDSSFNEDSLFDVSFEHVANILEQEKNRSLKYLSNALIKNED